MPWLCGSGGRSFAGVIIGICEQCHGSGQCAVMSAAVLQKLNPTRFDDLSSTPPFGSWRPDTEPSGEARQIVEGPLDRRRC